MNTHNTAVQVRGVRRCVKIQHRTRTCITRLGNTAALPVPVLHPSQAVWYRYNTTLADLCSTGTILCQPTHAVWVQYWAASWPTCVVWYNVASANPCGTGTI